MRAEGYTSVMSKAPSRKKEQPPLEVGVRELRDHLSAWLEEVKAGHEVVITERGRPVARLVSTGRTSKLDALIAAGVVTPAAKPAQPANAYPRPKPRGGDVSDIVIEQRRSRDY